MKSPITGYEMIKKTEYITITINGKEIQYISHFYECTETKEKFTTTELDEINLSNLNKNINEEI